MFVLVEYKICDLSPLKTQWTVLLCLWVVNVAESLKTTLVFVP